MTKTLKIHTDGGSRGNPGPAACAAVFLDQDQVVFEQGLFLGTTTNNQAEYQGVLLALNELAGHPAKYQQFSQIDFYLDSELVVKQLKGEYKIKNSELQPLALQIFQIIRLLPQTLSFTHVRRHLNKLPDTLLNQTLDSQK